ncbi:hypothetical protein JL720_43 [Aureococcus anophagefferens]|nr:hypothetical protein JL720_43 [Aureococcus anophagefferens]
MGSSRPSARAPIAAAAPCTLGERSDADCFAAPEWQILNDTLSAEAKEAESAAPPLPPPPTAPAAPAAPADDGGDDDDDDDARGGSARRQEAAAPAEPKSMTDQQRVERRERNREHAKRSRIRKKFLLESLLEQVSDLRDENKSLRQAIRDHLPDEAHDVLQDCITEESLLLRADDASAQQNFAVSDPSLPDNPIVYASGGFLQLTGYAMSQVIGRNCRFLQGPGTDPKAVDRIRRGVAEGVDTSVCLLNYKADGTPFWNQFFVASLRDADGSIVNYVGVQCEVNEVPIEEIKERAKRMALLDPGARAGEETRRARRGAATALKGGTPGEPSECCAFYTALLAALRRRPQVVEGCLKGVDVVFPPVDVGVVHYPSFLGELAATGEAKDAFFLRRLAPRAGEWLAETRLEPGQVALIVDAESSMTPCSRLLAALAHRFEAAVHATICATEGATARRDVVYGDDWVLPFSELLDYRDFAVVIREEDVLHTANILRAVPPGRRDALQAAGRAAFLRYFATVDARLDGLFAVLARRRRARDETHTVARTIAASWAAPCDDDELALLRRAQGQG